MMDVLMLMGFAAAVQAGIIPKSLNDIYNDNPC